MEGDCPALHAFCALHNGERFAEALENGALFDVKFEIGGKVLSLNGGVANAVNRDAAGRECSFESCSLAVGASAVGVDGLGSGEGGGAEETAAEASALFVSPIDELNGAGRPAVVLACEMFEDLKPGEDAEAAVEPSAVGNGIQMTAEHERAFGRTGESDPVVPGGVIVMFDRKAGELLLEP
jgi:hypothetical protein